MTWAAPLTRAGIADYLVETYDFDARQHGAYTLLMMRYAVAGPLPYDEKRLADICRVSRRIWSNRIWPAIQQFFTPGDDGLVHHEGLDALETATGLQTKRSAAASKAAQTRWVNEAARKAKAAADAYARTHANAYADACESHTESDAISMRGASETHAKTDAFASSGASAVALAQALPPPSLSSLSSSDSLESQNPTEREGGRAGAYAPTHADACESHMRPHANAYASACEPHTENAAISMPDAFATHVPVDARTHAVAAKAAPAGRQRPPPRVPFPSGWKLSEDGRALAARLGLHPETEADRFRDHYLSNGEVRADWDASFRSWLGKADRFQPVGRQAQLPPMGIAGGKAASVPAAAAHDPLATLARRFYASDRNGPAPPSANVHRQQCDAGHALTALAWIGAMHRWMDRGKLGPRPPEFLDYLADPAEYDSQVADWERSVASRASA